MSVPGSIAGIPMSWMIKDPSNAMAQADYFVELTRGINPTVNTLANQAQYAGGYSPFSSNVFNNQPAEYSMANMYLGQSESYQPQLSSFIPMAATPKKKEESKPKTTNTSSKSSNQNDKLTELLKKLIAALEGKLAEKDENGVKEKDAQEKPSVSGNLTREALLQFIVDHYDELNADNDHLVGIDDINDILNCPEKYSPELVDMAEAINRNKDVLTLADWTQNSTWGSYIDGKNVKNEYSAALNLLKDRENVSGVINFLRENYDQIKGLAKDWSENDKAGITYADLEKLRDGALGEEGKAIFEKIMHEYGQGHGKLKYILFNASGNGNGGRITLEGLDKLQEALSAGVVGTAEAPNEEAQAQDTPKEESPPPKPEEKPKKKGGFLGGLLGGIFKGIANIFGSLFKK